MMKNLSRIVSLFMMFLLVGNIVIAQSNKVSIVINNPETFIQVIDNETVLDFSIIILDGFIDGKWIKSQAEKNSNVIKIGVSNIVDPSTVERNAYLKVKGEPVTTFAEVLTALECDEVKYNGKVYSLIDFISEIKRK